MKVDICNWSLLCCKKSLKNITKPIVILNICYDFAQFLCYIMYYYPTMSHHQQWFLNRVMRDFLVHTTTAQSTTHSQSQTLVLQYLMNFRQHVFLQKRKKSVGRRSCRRRIFLIHRKVYGIWMKKVDLVFASKSWRPSWDLFSYIRIGPGSGLVRTFGSTSYPIVPIWIYELYPA